ncbi:hypothetical protein TELCIR_24492, partial [Teladorsagia circumcincta]
DEKVFYGFWGIPGKKKVCCLLGCPASSPYRELFGDRIVRYTTSVSATAREGETLLMVSASDDDVDDAVEYTLMGDDPMTQSFRLHPRHGTLSIVKPLDSLGSGFAF